MTRGRIEREIRPNLAAERRRWSAVHLLVRPQSATQDTAMRKVKKAIIRLFRTLVAGPDYSLYDPPYPGDGV